MLTRQASMVRLFLLIVFAMVFIGCGSGGSSTSESAQNPGGSSSSSSGSSSSSSSSSSGGGSSSGGWTPPEISVVRGGQYFDFDERFNRYYTDSAYTPVETIYVSPTGSGNGA
ncbi:MAG: hypothetical protein WAU91_10215, partial [Desulfatitalea sp.]